MKRRQFLHLTGMGMLPLTASARTTPVTGIVLDQRFAIHQLSPQHPESPARYVAIEQAMHSTPQLLANLNVIPLWTTALTEPWLSLIHSEQHILGIQRNHPELYKHALWAVSGCLAAVEAVMTQVVQNAFCACRPPGHHALNTGNEEGFCFFNNVAIAARYAQHVYGLERIAIVDWDYHHGNGTEWAFYEDDSVLFFSSHDQFAYPGTGDPLRRGRAAGEGYNINVHLDCGTTDQVILEVYKTRLLPALEKFKPDLILLSAGFDSRQDDLLGCFDITDSGFTQLTQLIKAAAEQHCAGRLVSVLEGGYNIQGTARAVVAHLNALSS